MATKAKSNRRQSNARYYARTRDRIILRESELRPSTILELHPADRRVERLRQLYLDLTGHEAPQPNGDDE